jgi:branched-subunit amino acid aminotransferase/4-amino-4-deoxychorismate lyase
MSIFDHAMFNGNLVPLDQAQVSIFHPAYFSSFGIYETVKVDQGRPFFLEEHLCRLLNSARMIELDLGIDTATLGEWFQRLARVDDSATWSLKIIALGPTTLTGQPVIAMQPTPLPTYPPDYYRHGAAAITYEGERLMPQCKSLNTLVNFLARRKSSAANALEALLHHNGFLTEGTRSNLFAVQQGVIISPPNSQILSGITREIILQVTKEAGLPVVEAPLPVDLTLCDEFFISSTSMHVMPVTRIDDRPVGEGQVGPTTRKVMALFNTYYDHYMSTAQKSIS